MPIDKQNHSLPPNATEPDKLPETALIPEDLSSWTAKGVASSVGHLVVNGSDAMKERSRAFYGDLESLSTAKTIAQIDGEPYAFSAEKNWRGWIEVKVSYPSNATAQVRVTNFEIAQEGGLQDLTWRENYKNRDAEWSELLRLYTGFIQSHTPADAPLGPKRDIDIVESQQFFAQLKHQLSSALSVQIPIGGHLYDFTIKREATGKFLVEVGYPQEIASNVTLFSLDTDGGLTDHTKRKQYGSNEAEYRELLRLYLPLMMTLESKEPQKTSKDN